ncbi:hypothetical protein JOL79_24050 [Microbispora sp. RL4-1S]|uniref:ATP-grasp domain-containing protein n=1 Tax=Microbispora oryzae TaxID=2806554 RepID=A0A941AJY5_9ACTN|nr:hypothetical protein [Microbispora oryzae]MBP2706885.1 hypothetical protein [Microbispora oryzae]
MSAHPLAFDTSVPALTFKVGAYPVHHGGLGVARTLGRAGIPVYGVHEDRLAPAGLSRYAAGRFVWPTAGQEEHRRQLLAGIEWVAGRIGRPAVLVPTDDHAAIFVADHADTLRRWFLFAAPSAELVREVTDKAALHRRCRDLGVPVPEATVITDSAGLLAYAETASFPVVAKRAVPTLLADGRRARSTRILRGAADLLRTDVSSPVLLQEHIPAGPGDDWLFHGYCDASSECLAGFTGRKLRSFPADAGETALGRVERNRTLEDQARSLLAALGYRGAVSLDYRYDRRDGTYRLLDFNPRVGAVFRLFTTGSGVDVVRALHLDLTGRPVPRDGAVDGRALMVEGYDVRSSWSSLAAGGLTPRQWWSSLRSVRETAWIAADDPVPAVVALARSAGAASGLWPPPPHRPGPPAYLEGRAARRRR